MRKGFLLLISFSLLAIGSAAQDSLVRWSDLTFLSEFEREAYAGYLKQKKQERLFDLLLATDAAAASKVTAARGRVEAEQQVLRKLISDKKKPDKQLKAVYDQVHATFLRKYEIICRFPEIFSTGAYNCVTATALYALTFDKLGIPYTIQEKPTHVFLVAYPNQHNILVETTTPIAGYMTFDARYKESFVTTLKNQKLIGAAEIESTGIEALFNKYYFQNETIDLPQLVGIHYLNDALFFADVKDYDHALHQAQKAYLLYPTPKGSFIIMSLLTELLDDARQKPLERAARIAQISRFESSGITAEMIQGEFMRLTEQVLQRENNRSLYQQCFQILEKGVSPEIRREVAYLFHYEMARSYYNQGNYLMAKKYFALALNEQPNNVELSAILVNSLGLSLRNERNLSAAADTLLAYRKRFPILEENTNFSAMLANAYAACFGAAFEKGKLSEGETFLKKFEELVASQPQISLESELIGRAYSEAASFYFNKGQKTKARALIEKGLEFSPDNRELRIRKQMIR